MHPFLTATNVAYALPDGSVLFRDVNFALASERVGLVGANGTGKSTLLQILVGHLAPSQGACVRSGGLVYLPQQEELAAGATVAEALDAGGRIGAYQRMLAGAASRGDLALLDDAWDLIGRLEGVRERMGIGALALEHPVADLSGGERTRVKLAALLLQDPDVLLLDEPTNHLDTDAQHIVHELVRTWPKGIVVASHDRRLLRQVDRIVELSPSGLRAYGGGYGFYREQREREQAAALESLDAAEQRSRQARSDAQAILDRQAHRSAQGRKRAPTLGLPRIALGGMKRRAQATAAKLKDRHEAKVATLEGAAAEARLAVRPDPRIIVDLGSSAARAGKRIASLRGVNHRFAPEGPDLWPEPLDLDLLGTDRVAVRGPNGSGKSTLLEILRGRIQPAAGTVQLGTARVGYLDQGVALLDSQATPLVNLRRAAPTRSEHEVRILLGRFGLEGDAVHKRVEWLSGGERIRTGLACLLCADQAPELLLLDEPTNSLDLATQEALASALRGYRGCLVLVSHDPDVIADAGVERFVDLRSTAPG